MSIDPAAYGRATEPRNLNPATPPATPAKPGEWGLGRLERVVFGADGLTFDDLLDVVNPLHHLPVVSTIYRSLSGDTIAPGPRLAGGGLFGGFIGLASAAVNVAVEESTGKDIGDHVYAMVSGEEGWPGDGQAPGGTYVAGLEPEERIAALLAGAAGTPAGAPPDAAQAQAPGLPAAAPAAANLDVASLEPDQRVAALLSAAPTPAAASAGATGPGAASGAEDAMPSLNSSEWQSLTRALRAYGARQQAQAQPAGWR